MIKNPELLARFEINEPKEQYAPWYRKADSLVEVVKKIIHHY